MNDLSLALSKLRRILLTAYAVALICFLSLFFALNFVHQRRLAESFALSARSSLVINDLRQAILTLNPAINGSFESVRFFSNDGAQIFSLPPTAAIAPSWNPFLVEVEIPVLSDPSKPNSAMLGQLSFLHNSWYAMRWAVLAWGLLLLSAIPFSRWAKKLIETRHLESLALEAANAKASIAKQVAHDIRSPLSALMIVEKSLKDLSETQRSLLSGAAGRIARIADDLLEQSRPAPDVENAALVIDQVVAELVTTLGPNSQIEILKVDLPAISLGISSVIFARMISNLLKNATEAIDGAGRVIVRGTQTRNTVEIAIEDSGRGMSAATLAKAGQQGFTEGKINGNGLGLAHAIASVKARGGEIQISSQPGQGTVVRIVLPKTRPN